MRPLPCAAVSVRYSGGLNSFKHGTAFREGEPEIRHREGRLRHIPCEAQFPAPNSVLSRGLPVVPVPGSRTQTHSKERYSLLYHEGSNQRATPFFALRPGPGL